MDPGTRSSGTGAEMRPNTRQVVDVCSLVRVHLFSMSRASYRSREILAFIQSRIEADGRPPTLEEIAEACGFKSRSAVQKHVRALEASGKLHVTPGRARSARPKRAKEQAAGSATLFEVTPLDIQDLSDADLRALVARLCMAALVGADLPPTSVVWGGDQRAPDGGIDVRVKAAPNSNLPAPLDRGAVGFQVKATPMRPADIQREMCPGGVLRPSIRDLIQAGGAYVIAASDLVADEGYQGRVDAIKAAAGLSDAAGVTLDYFDARRLTDWTNHHPGVVAWVRSRLGRPLQGWQPFGPWASTAAPGAVFFADEKLRVTDPIDCDNKLSLLDGLAQVRRTLKKGGHSVRLTGLSGVGKTRFAQALFEEGAAPGALPEGLAVYTDTAHSPTPSPAAVLDELMAAHRRAILIVDNCGAQLHNQLSARCRTSDRVSLLTIEYDIREELASETNVFHLEAGSDELIEHVLQQRFPHISQVNRKTITRFADGNSRVAIALAQTMERHDSLAGLNDDELFNRLFWLGKEINHDLKAAAEVCSLVYSFDVDNTDGELAQLAALADLKPLALYRHVGDLEERGLAQRRGPWRAVLPHAVANRLAARALATIPIALIERQLVHGQGRLLRSFSRRLGYLHRSPEAAAIVDRWLAPGGMLDDCSQLSELQLDVMENIAPVDPAATLDAIQRAINGPRGEELLASSSFARVRLVRLVRLIAFDDDRFDACLGLLLRFASAEPEENRSDPTRSVISSLFQIYLSGTHATTQRRAAWVRELLGSANEGLRNIGLAALNTALECCHLSSHYTFEFGARVRDYGAYPRGPTAREWFDTFIQIAVDTAMQGGPASEQAANALASQFRSLWTVAGMHESLESAAATLRARGWEHGWLAMRQTLAFDGKKGLPPTSHARLVRLEQATRPSTLVGQVKAIVLSSRSAGMDFADGEPAIKGYERADKRARELGELVAADDEAFAQVAPLVVANAQGRQWPFGEGLAASTPSLEATWTNLVAAYEATSPGERSVQVLRGFLCGTSKRDRGMFDRLLDQSMTRTSLIEWVPVLQLSAELDERGCDRLLALINNPSVPAWVFQHLGLGRATEPVPSHRLAELLERLGIKPDGLAVALDILHMHLYGDPKPIGPQLTACAHSLIANAPLTRHYHGLDHGLSELIQRFLVGSVGEPPARALLGRINEAIAQFAVSRYDFTETLKALFKVQPMLALDALVGDDDPDGAAGYVRRDALSGGPRSNTLMDIPEDALIAWCRAGGPNRWSRVAPLVPAYDSRAEGAPLEWSGLVKALIANAPNPATVAEAVVYVLIPTSWSGSRAEIIRQRLPLLDELEQLVGPGYEVEIAQWRRNVTEVMEREARRELDEHRLRNERFE